MQTAKGLDKCVIEDVIAKMKESTISRRDEYTSNEMLSLNKDTVDNELFDKIKELWLKKLQRANVSEKKVSNEIGNNKIPTPAISNLFPEQEREFQIAQLDGTNDEPLIEKNLKSSTSDEDSEDHIDIPSQVSENDDKIENDHTDSNADEDKSDSEEFLNTDDDIPNADEELKDILTYTENLIVCKAEKIIHKSERQRVKYKFHLKDGLMRIKGKEFTFSRASGEAPF